jgi:hypothetical protein
VLGDGKSPLRPAHLDIITGHLGKQGHQHVTAVCHGGTKVRAGGFDRTSHPAEQIDFPTGIKARLE